MKTPRTPSPKRSREVIVSADSPAGSSSISELSYPDSGTHPSLTASSSSSRQSLGGRIRRSPTTIALAWVFCAGLFFFTTESIRYAATVVNYSAAGDVTNMNDFLDDVVARIAPTTQDIIHRDGVPQNALDSSLNNRNLQQGSLLLHELTSPTTKPVRGSTPSNIASTTSSSESKLGRRVLKMGRRRGRGRGMGGMMGGGRNDVLFLNGGLTQQASGSVTNRDNQLTRVRTNINVFQPGLGFLPAGDPNLIILAPGPRRMGMGGMGGGGRGGRGMRGGSKGGRSGAKGRSGSKGRTFNPTFRPTPRPTTGPTPRPTSDITPSPSNRPSYTPSVSPSLQPSVSKEPSQLPSSQPSTRPSLSNMPSLSKNPSGAPSAAA